MHHFRPLWTVAAVAAVMTLSPVAMADSVEAWGVLSSQSNPELPGERIDVTHGGELAASLIHGEGQQKVFLHVYDRAGNLLTNPGLDADGEEVGLYPHHRGIFIGWNQIRSDLGTHNVWAVGRGGSVVLEDYLACVGDGHARLIAFTEWRGEREDSEGDDLLLTESRRMTISRPDDQRTIVDFETTLTAEHDLELGGDLQHAGVHYRAHHSMEDREDETAYAWAPADLDDGDGRIISDDLRWVQFYHPVGDNWYLVTQLDAPSNPTQELSWRAYGRFGFFHKDELAAGERRQLSYRFIIEEVDAPADAPQRSDAQAQAHREAAEAYYEAYVREQAD